ncbi:uncharacterized protein B0I36DRAFT_347681 [Microdochium trichocladiopsis]|uniref:Nucleoside phosphorylase domain-containing protein n=1 Tax=Microdochium trichocladiopsis TaxID=1682393 RepID=A0A9P8YAB1_9PEZI|nr:uncharacterized protein B0I36DRAFT_347681 [Microdochium trichocladiopsis]KAH7035974.1 hypothetical protein B0I36DRAFT_347681 [Microdochium trichocladiopsis]
MVKPANRDIIQQRRHPRLASGLRRGERCEKQQHRQRRASRPCYHLSWGWEALHEEDLGEFFSYFHYAKSAESEVSNAITRKKRPSAETDRLSVHLGAVGSADTVMKSGVDRDIIAARYQLVALEMEAAGMWEELPCIVVKGVCDYADSHKAKGWQPFAAASAAAVTKALLSTIQASDPQQRVRRYNSGRDGELFDGLDGTALLGKASMIPAKHREIVRENLLSWLTPLDFRLKHAEIREKAGLDMHDPALMKEAATVLHTPRHPTATAASGYGSRRPYLLGLVKRRERYGTAGCSRSSLRGSRASGIAKELLPLVRPSHIEDSGVSLLVTSKIWSGYEQPSKGFHREQITTGHDDLHLFVDRKLAENENVQVLIDEDPAIRDKVRSLITWKSYAVLSKRLVGEKDKNIDSQRAYRCLAWTVMSAREFTTEEFFAALSCDPVTKGMALDDRTRMQTTIRDISCGLITLQQGDLDTSAAERAMVFRGDGFQLPSALKNYYDLESDGLQDLDDLLYEIARVLELETYDALLDQDNGGDAETQAQPSAGPLSVAQRLQAGPSTASEIAKDLQKVILRSTKASAPLPKPHTNATHIISWYGYIPVLRHFLGSSRDVNSIDEFFRQPIAVAFQRDHMDVVSVCLDYGAELDITSPAGRQILLKAIHRDGTPRTLVRSMVNRNHERLNFIHESSRRGTTNLAGLSEFVMVFPMFLACLFFVSAGLSRQPSLQSTARVQRVGEGAMRIYRKLRSDNLLAAVERDEAEKVLRMSQKGEWDVKDKTFGLGRPSAFLAVELGNHKTVTTLIQAGVDVNVQDDEGNTPLIRTAAKKDLALVKDLLQRGADVHVKNRNGQTAWSVKLNPDNKLVLDELELHGATDPMAVGSDGLPLLYPHAASDKGLNASHTTRYYWAPLHWTANGGHVECVEALLRAGADPSPVSDTNETPLEMAMRANQLAVVDILRAAGALTAAEHYGRQGDSSFSRWNRYSSNSSSSSIFSSEAEDDDYDEDELERQLKMELEEEEEEEEDDLDPDTPEDDSAESDEACSTQESDSEKESLDYVDGLGMALLRLEESAMFPDETKRSMVSFLMREVGTVVGELYALFDSQDTPQVTEAAVERWNEIIGGIALRPTIKALLEGEH